MNYGNRQWAEKPSETLGWQEVSTKDSLMLIDPNIPSNIDPERVMGKYKLFTRRHAELGYGCEGSVRAVGELAVKRFYNLSYQQRGNVEDLAINVGISRGLDRLSPVESGYAVRGVKIHAALYQETADDKYPVSYWVMERLHPEKPTLGTPNSDTRIKLRTAALQLTGINPNHAFYDDCPTSRNFIITKKRSHEDKGEIVLIDSRYDPSNGQFYTYGDN